MNPDRATRKGKGRFGRLGRLLGFWLLAWLALASAPTAWGAVRYVKADAAGANTGASWADAYTDLQSALAAAQSGDEIWVAAGTYKPTTGTDRSISFTMTSNAAIYGGFAGTETTRSQRDWSAHATVLSGDIGTIGTATDNSYHVVVGANGAVLDGFTITGGYANVTTLTDYHYGGGMLNDSVSPTIANCTFTSNGASYGGGMWNKGASPTMTNCTFANNTAIGYQGCGGGMFNDTASPTIANCTFTNNTAIGGGDGYGGGMFNGNSSLTVTNCTFTNNAATGGGGMFHDEASLTVTNCIFWNNSAPQKSEICAFGSSSFKYCDIQGSGGSAQWDTALGTDGGGNIDADPLFANASTPAGTDGVWRTADDGLRLLVGSPCIDAGTATGAPTTDILGNAREGLTDIGAYEHQTPPAGAPTVASAASATNNTKPTWTWTSGGGGAGTFRYQIDSTTGTWTTTAGMSYTPATALADGAHALYVEEENSAGYWSAAGSYTVTVDTTPPGKPTVTSDASLTRNKKPTWTWISGGGGNGTFRYQLDATDGDGWTTTTATSYAPTTALADGTHALHVEERDDAGNWSEAGSYSVTVDMTLPNAPTVTASLTTPRRPVWSWTSGGGGNGTFEFQLDATAGDAWTTTTATRFTAFEDLSLGEHVFYVRESDNAGNWSAIGSCAIAAGAAAHGWLGYR
jgi:hypothetical protein